MGRFFSIVAIASSLILTVSAHAEMTIENYLNAELDLKLLNSAWLFGVQDGFALANAENLNREHPPMYCQPPHLSMTRKQTTDLLDDYIKKNPQLPHTTELSITLLLALEDAFPCPH
jgi:hypothetical protein